MELASETPRQPLGRWLREPVNTLTHGLGALLGAIGLVVLLVLSEGEPWRTVAFSVYGASLIALYLASSVMHGVIAPATVIRRLRVLDHAAIFLLIAGTYTPITLVALRSETPPGAGRCSARRGGSRPSASCSSCSGSTRLAGCRSRCTSRWAGWR
jgi:predicted membrane channel-forming protein YqfA (hemolysin III family)